MCIADFGLSCRVTDSASIYNICGTPGYIAPEILRREGPFTPEGDLFSIGAVLFNTITGLNLFPGAKPEIVLEYNTWLDPKQNILKHTQKLGLLCQDFLLGLVKVNKRSRFNAGQALAHPWLGLVSYQGIHSRGVSEMACDQQPLKMKMERKIISNLAVSQAPQNFKMTSGRILNSNCTSQDREKLTSA